VLFNSETVQEQNPFAVYSWNGPIKINLCFKCAANKQFMWCYNSLFMSHLCLTHIII